MDFVVIAFRLILFSAFSHSALYSFNLRVIAFRTISLQPLNFLNYLHVKLFEIRPHSVIRPFSHSALKPLYDFDIELSFLLPFSHSTILMSNFQSFGLKDIRPDSHSAVLSFCYSDVEILIIQF